MHRELLDLLDRAKKRIGAQSERQLARALAINASALLGYRRGQMLPSDDCLIRICALASEKPQHWLLLLNMWRSRGPTRAAYSDLVKKVGQQSLPISTSPER